MARTYRIGILGLTHDHVWGNLKELAALDNGELVAAADPNEPLLEKVKDLHGCNTYTGREAMLEAEELDAVYVYADNAGGADLTEWAANQGLHVMVEKPMASNLEGADRMMAAARQNGVRLMVNWPFAWSPALQEAIRMAREGEIGDVWEVKYRAAHAGPKELGCTPFFYNWLHDASKNGAGALMDYCCYGADLAVALLGTPSRVTGVTGRLVKEYHTVEDNAVIILSYPRAMAITEASWSQQGDMSSYLPHIYGTEATLLVTPKGNGGLKKADQENKLGAELEVPAPPPHLASASAHFLWALETGNHFFILCQDRVSRDAQEVLEAGLISAEEGGSVSLPL